MKTRVYPVILLALALLLLPACDTVSKPLSIEGFSLKEAVKLTCDMKELAESKEYREVVSSSPLIGEILDAIAASDYESPEGAFIVHLSDDILLDALFGEEGIPTSIAEKLKRQINGSVLANMINGADSVQTLAATSSVSWSESYIKPEGWTRDLWVILEYPDEFSSMVSFGESGNGVITAYATFFKNTDINIMEAICEYLGAQEPQHKHYSKAELEKLLI